MDTNKLTKQINTMLHPRAALIAYSTDGGDTYFLEVRSIDNEGAMSEGRPVTVDFINELIKGYSERHSSTPHGRIPTNMLWSDTRKGYEKYIWYNPPQKRMMFFKESLHIENAEYNLPGVIYEVRDERMNIYAYIDKELKPETELYAAPFFNVTGRQRLTSRQRLPTTNYLSTGRRSSGLQSSHTSEVTEIPQRATLYW